MIGKDMTERKLDVGVIFHGDKTSEDAPVEVRRTRNLKATVTIKNNTSQELRYRLIYLYVFFAETLSDSSGDSEADYHTWMSEADIYCQGMFSPPVLDPGGTLTTSCTVSSSTWKEETDLDAGVVVRTYKPVEWYSLKVTDGVKIVLPQDVVEIMEVNPSSYDNPDHLIIKVRNNSGAKNFSFTMHIYVDGEDRYEISDEISADSMITLTIPTSELNLSEGEHFIYCDLTRIEQI